MQQYSLPLRVGYSVMSLTQAGSDQCRRRCAARACTSLAAGPRAAKGTPPRTASPTRALDEIGGDVVQLDVPRLRPAGDAGDSGSAQQHLDRAVTNADTVAEDHLGLHPRAPYVPSDALCA